MRLAVLAAAVSMTAACANYAAMLKAGTTEVFVAEAAYDEAFAAVAAGAKESGYDHVKEYKAKNYIYLQRGVGYGESTYVDVRFKPNGNATEITIAVKSSKSGKEIVDQLAGAVRKRVKLS
jgi:hypothetical protein